MAIAVDADNLQFVKLYRWLPPFQRLTAWPFVLLYAAWLLLCALHLRPELGEVYLGLAALGCLHVLALLFTVWSVDFRCFAHATEVADISIAEVCKVVPVKYGGLKEVVPISRRLIKPSEKVLLGLQPPSSPSDPPPPKPNLLEEEGREEVRIEFRKQQLIYDERDSIFRPLSFPDSEPLGVYFKWGGYGTEAKVEAARERWGENAFHFPQPTFLALFKEQVMEPFFVFQLFCVALWCLDDYWYYSLFTLAMLLLFESTVVTSRLRTLLELRQVRVDSQALLVLRGGKWVRLSGSELVPGDVVSIGRPSGAGSDERTVPADLLLLAGTAIANEALLTGESTPQWKAPVLGSGRDGKELLSVSRDKANVLFGGTKILQHTPDKVLGMKTPDGGCLAVVIRTGFDTSQGSLMRTILFSTEKVSANNLESGLFILFLVFFALLAAGYVLMKGLEDTRRSRYKLLLNCSLIITSVIPPELPMELSIAVNTSLVALIKQGIFCTEPFRIPFGGKVDVCCFDKTGTLTSDDMEFRGVVGIDGSSDLCSDTSSLPSHTVLTLAACHSLVLVDNKMVGDPLERASLKAVDWLVTSDDKASPRRTPQHAIQIVLRHHFASHLKRMAVVVRAEGEAGFTVLLKGAPETVEQRLREVPLGYASIYKQYTRQGARVLALAFKQLPEMPMSEVRSLDRDSVEMDLQFAGFAVFACPIRSDSPSVLEELHNSSHDLVMITGDQSLTACHVAAQVHIVSRPPLILTPSSDPHSDSAFNWLSVDEVTCIPFSLEEVEQVAAEFDFCVAGDGLSFLQRINALSRVVPLVQVFARVSPEQKEVILQTLKAAGRTTLMCGDGTNDVGALKQAHVGVALLNAVPPRTAKEKEGGAAAETTRSRKGRQNSSEESGDGSASSTGGRQRSRVGGRGGGREASNSSSGAAAEDGRDGARLSAREMQQRRVQQQKERLQKMMKELEDGADGKPPMVKLGDASMASPFTAKHASVAPVRDILRQGRATLVTTLQMFKILGLNCLATAYVLSVMYLDGVKLGDYQATISGMFTAAFFLFISQARPLEKLSPERPHPKVFSFYVILSILGQFAMHMAFLIAVVNGAQKFMPEECIEPDSKFSPNLVNTVSYMANMMIQVATFAVNYIGHPFNQSIRENKPFFYALTSAAVFFTVIMSDAFRELNDGMELVELPQPYGVSLLGMAALMFVGCFAWERFLRWCFHVKCTSNRRSMEKRALEKKVD